MKLKRLLLATTVALGLTATTPIQARADPVSIIATAFVVALGEGAAIAVATFIVNSTLYTAASFAIGKLTGVLSSKNKQALQDRQASVTGLALGEVPREAVVGIACVGGSLVDIWNWGGQYGTDNVTRCVALADHAVEDLYGYYVDDVFYEYQGNGVQPGFNGTLTIDFRNATADGHAPPAYAAQAGWEPGDRMTAVTHVWVTTKFDEKVWTQGHPKFRWVMHGLCAFDPRNGDVWEDRSTHSFTRNPTLLRHAIARGIYAEGRQGEPEHLLIGRGLTEEEAPADRLIAPANLCDEQIGDDSRYMSDGAISADMDFITVEQLFADAMAGVIIQHEGSVEVEPGQAKAVVATITDADLVVGEPVTFSEFMPDNEGGRINTVVPRFVSPAQGWADHSGPVRRSLDDIAKDGGPRETTLSLPLVAVPSVADRNAEILRLLSRCERRATVVLPPWFGWLEEGDWIAWQSDRRHGGATVRYRIEGWTLGKDWRMRLSLREIASSVFGVPDPIEDLAEVPPAPVPVDALALPGASAQAITLPGETSVIPAVRFTWDNPVDPAMRSARAEIRILGDTDASPTTFDDLGAGVGIATNGVAADQVLQARLVPVGDPSRPVLPSAWQTITTGALVAGDVSQDSPIWSGLRGQARDNLQRAIEAAQSLLEEERRREISVGDVLDRLDLGFMLDPVTRSAIIRTETIADGVGPGGLPETLVHMSTRLVAADAANTAAVAAALFDARAYADTVSAEAVIGLAAVTQMNLAISASALTIQSWVTDEIANARIDLVTASQLASSFSTAQSQWESYATTAAAQAIIGLDTVAARNGALAVAKGQWESYTDDEVTKATIGLDTVAARNGALAVAKGQWESYTDDEITSATIGLDTVAARDLAVAASALTLQAWVDVNYNYSSALLAVETTLDDTTSAAYLALSTAQGNEAYVALGTDVNGRVTEMRVNGVSRAVDFLADYFNVTAGSGGGIAVDGAAGRFKIFDGTSKTVLKAGGDIRLWSGPTSVADGAETAANGVIAIGPGVTGGGQFNGRTLSSPFEAAGGGGVVSLGSGWTTVASTTAHRMLPGRVTMWAQWNATLTAAEPTPEAPIYGVAWRLVDTNTAGGDGQLVCSGYVSGPAGFPISQGVTRANGQITTSGLRVLRLQMALDPDDDTPAASVNTVRLAGDYLEGAGPASF